MVVEENQFRRALVQAYAEEDIAPRLNSYLKEAWMRFSRNKPAFWGLVLLCILITMAIIGPWLSPYPYYETHLSLNNQPPSLKFWFGTDDLGRDLFVRTWYGARISLCVGFVAAFIDLVIGVLWGGTAALAGGKIDNLMMRTADILYAIPYLLVVILLIVVIGSGLLPIIIALTIIGWINMARIVRGQLLQIKELDYVQASRAFGASNWWILRRHMIPNAIGSILITMTLTIPTAIFTEAFLSFLGLGIQAPVASWGTMASEGLPAMSYYPWRLFFPAFFISITLLAFNMVGDGLSDAFDPKRRARG
ncbi:MAG: ABC transporter permease [Parachlamydiales bacterium]|nr:ABC transporter permease [Parachlamydiales bacterium]